MTTVVRLKGANFNNPNLPVFIPIDTDGLIGGYLFNGKLTTIKGEALVFNGTHPYDETGVTIDSTKGNIVTKINDNTLDNATIFTVSRAVVTAATNSFIVGTYAQGFSLYAQPNTGRISLWSRDSLSATVQASPLIFDVTKDFLCITQRTNQMVRMSLPLSGLASERSTTGTINKVAVPLRFGEENVGGSSIIHISAALIYNRAMSAAEIATIAQQLKNQLGFDMQ